MALAHCILGKFLGVVFHCFSPPLHVPTFAARCLYVRNDARGPSSERWNRGREICPLILPKFRLPHKFRDLLYAANLRHGTDGFTSPPKEGLLRIVYIYIYIHISIYNNFLTFYRSSLSINDSPCDESFLRHFLHLFNISTLICRTKLFVPYLQEPAPRPCREPDT